MTSLSAKLASLRAPSICVKIAGTLNESDFARFEKVYENPTARQLIEKNAMVQECLHRLTSQPITPVSKLASAAIKRANAPGYDVVQIRPSGYGYIVKVSAAPAKVAPQETQMTPQQAQQALPPEALQTADQQGVATMTNVEAEPDPLEEMAQPEPVAGFGLYKVLEAGTNKQIVGYVIPGLFDPRMGGPSSLSAFVNGGQYAVQPSILGTLVGLNFDLPHSDTIRGLGIFYKTNGKALIATIPFVIASEVQVEGRKYYAGSTYDTGEEVQITISEGIKKPIATSPQEIVIPADFNFLALDNEIQLEGGMGPEGAAVDPMQQAKVASFGTMMEVRAWEGGCSLRGPVFEKIGSGDYNWVDGLFWMAAAGVPQNLGVEMLTKAASAGKPVRMYGCRALSPVGDAVKEAHEKAASDLSDVRIPQRVCLLAEMAAITMDKQASSLVDTDSVDAVLSLNFINPENVSSFVESLPQLQEASTKLAALVLATQLGLQSIPKTAAVRAMFALEDVISGLKSLQTTSL